MSTTIDNFTESLIDKNKRKSLGVFIVSVNIAIILGIISLFVIISTSNNYKLREQNIADIRNINQSSANISSMFFMNQKRSLSDIVQYITTKGLSHDEALSYICDSHSYKKDIYELVNSKCTGYAAIKTEEYYVPVDYTHISYRNFNKVFQDFDNEDDREFSVEFTDGFTANRSCALHEHVNLKNKDGIIETYTLLIVSKSTDFSSLIELNAGYEGMSTVFIDGNGNYVISSADFKTENLFQYFYDYNNLTLDEKNKLATSLSNNTHGEYFYKNGRSQDSIFVYTAVPNTNWYCVSCVPISSFKQNEMNVQFTLWIALLLLVLMAFNMIWQKIINRQLKISIQNEKKAGEAKTEFLSRMSHDIRTPLNVILGMTLLAQREDNPPATTRELININQSGKFLLSLVNDILDLNKVESGKMELHLAPYSYKQFSSSIRAIIAPLCAEKNINFTVTGTDTDSLYMLDSIRVDQIFFNILSNSVKFTAPGGHITLTCSDEIHDDNTATLSFVAADDGIGMSQEFQEHMFEAFSQEQNNSTMANQGTGLGLAIVKRLIDLMCGTLRVESALNKGTSFYITLPVKKIENIVVAETKNAVSVARLSGKRVLLFEDNELNAEIAGTLLKDKGVSV